MSADVCFDVSDVIDAYDLGLACPLAENGPREWDAVETRRMADSSPSFQKPTRPPAGRSRRPLVPPSTRAMQTAWELRISPGND